MPVEALDDVLMLFRSNVPVSVCGLTNAGVPELSLHPPDVGAALEQPRREGVPRGVIRPVAWLSKGFQTFSRKKGYRTRLPLEVGKTTCRCSGDQSSIEPCLAACFAIPGDVVRQALSAAP